MKKLLLITSIIVSIFLVGCGNQLDKDYPPVSGNRIEVQAHYTKTYGADPGQWSSDVMKAYDRDMDNAPVVTE